MQVKNSALLGTLMENLHIPKSINLLMRLIKCKLFTDVSAEYGREIMWILSHKKVSLLSHCLGVSPKSYHNYEKLREMLNVLSIMHDKSGSSFVGIIEAKNTQFLLYSSIRKKFVRMEPKFDSS